ncbi:hypothetical protein ASF78_20670 [Cellulomonas sp. Leaf334]|nr:hypothetical protein ASF78_20670 [Cellulomonas sp. Leaf334]
MVVLACITFGGSAAEGGVQQPDQATRTVVSDRQPATCAEPGTGTVDPRPAPARHLLGTMRAV